VRSYDVPERFFRDLLEGAPDAFVIVDAEGVIRLVNGQVEELFGYPRGELVGQPVETLVPMRFHDVHPRHRSGYIDKPRLRPMGARRDLYARRRDGSELLARRKDGSEFPVEISLSPLATPDGVLVSAVVRDVTDRNRLQAESDRLRDELIATVSHELRTPLASIIGYTELMGDLTEEHLSEDARALLEVISRNARRELSLVDDLLTLASMTDGRVTMRTESVDLDRVAVEAVAAIRPRADEQGLSVVLDIVDVGRSRAVVGDAMRLGQVLDNLLTNAVKFSVRGGTIRVSLERERHTIVVRVSDTGVGVDPDEIPYLFERLFRARHAVERHVQGAGLGLPIAKAIVEAHHGSIEVHSEVGTGTTVTVRLPLPDQSAAGDGSPLAILGASSRS